MNTIVNFRKCTLTNEELLKAVDTLTDKMYQDGRIPDRQIPARPDADYDLLVGELIKRFLELEETKKMYSEHTVAMSMMLTVVKEKVVSLEKKLSGDPPKAT